jgi:hypothetical protein
MNLKFLDHEEALRLLKDHKDVLSEAVEQDSKFYASKSCPRCGGSCRKTGDIRTMFTGDDVLPQFNLECLACGEEWDPRTGITIKIGNIGKAFEPVIPIIGSRDE